MALVGTPLLWASPTTPGVRLSCPFLLRAGLNRIDRAESWRRWACPKHLGLMNVGSMKIGMTAAARKNGMSAQMLTTSLKVAVSVGDKVDDSVQTVVIVGAGIAGLSAALALHRVGVKSLVLEQSSSLRTSGTSLSLWTNAWRGLDYLGVGDGLREGHVALTEVTLSSRDEILLKNFKLSECPGGPHEVRTVQRKSLIQALARELPNGTIRLESLVKSIYRDPQADITKVELEDGSVISTKVLVGCDGVNSVVAQWMGLPPARYVGQIGFRGLADFPDGHEFEDTIQQYLGEGMRCGLVPASATKVYWFVCLNSPQPGPKVPDRGLLKVMLLELLKEGWPEVLTKLVENSPLESLSRSQLSDRWNIPGITPPLVKEGVTLAGDALHPMTPNLGQGGCTAIEDGIILAKTLGKSLSNQGTRSAEEINQALETYSAERQCRTFPITIKSFVLGTLLGIPFAPVIYIRNKIALPKLVGPRSFLSHTRYDVGALPVYQVTTE